MFPPAWTDVRGFLWDGWRAHIRYTYRGTEPSYEKRLRLRDCFVQIASTNYDGWTERVYRTGDSVVTAIVDSRCVYYWKANRGGHWHTECINTMIRHSNDEGRKFDLVGANSPQRALFKRQFGGALTPYYFVTTGDPKDVAAFWPQREAAVA